MGKLYIQRRAPFWAWLTIIFCILGSISNVQAQVSGTVYRDYDLNGIRSDTLPIEIGIENILVRAFVDLAKTPIITTTNSSGIYSFNAIQAPVGKPVRIEFANLPAGDYEGPFGSGSATRVQFVTAGASATAVNVGLNYPSDYCRFTNRVQLVTPCYINGNSQLTEGIAETAQAAKGDALVGFMYNASGVASPTNFPAIHLASAGEVGALWGLAYQRQTKKVFSAAVLKRHASYGPLGPGGIYVTDLSLEKTTGFLDVSSIGIDVGNDSHSGLSGNKLMPNADAGPMQDAGKKSFGGMDISEDDKTLYFVNLKDRKLYGVFIDSPARVPTASDVKSWNIPDPDCSNGDYRPWALKVYRGKIYIGVVCSAETSALQSDLKVTIYRVDPTSPNPTFETVLAFPIDFKRGQADLTTDPLNPQNSCAKYDHWLPWTSAWPMPCGAGVKPYFVMQPQPIVADIEFDDDGSMILGFLDRFGNLSGNQNYDPAGNGVYDGFTGGDLLRAYNNNGTYELEKNGKAGNHTGSGVGNAEGPLDANNVGGEFYGTDNWIFFGNVAHAEVTNGALTLIPGYNEVIASAFDPIEGVFKAGGLKAFNNMNGRVNRNYVIYTQSPGTFGKASGLGDSKAMCDPAPVEIGNRVWFDDNRDGIQDAYEPGVDGIILTLHDMEDEGLQLGSQTTHDGGQFYFNKSTVGTDIKFNHKYEVRMDTRQLALLSIDLTGAKPLSGGGQPATRGAGGRQAATSNPQTYFISPANRTSFTDSDQRDSDAELAGSSAVITLTTGNAGQNDFTHDLSMFSCPQLTNEQDTVNVCSGATVSSIVTDTKYLSRVDSVRFVVFSSPQSGTAMYTNSGVVLSTVKPGADQKAVLLNPPVNTANDGPASANQFIYAIIYPTPESVDCRQSDATVLTISPAFSASASGGKLTCSIKEVSLIGSAVYKDGTSVGGVVYAWTGPASFSSSQPVVLVSKPGMYTLTVRNPACLDAVKTLTAEVTADTVKPVMTTHLVPKLCSTCSAVLTATSPGATFGWTGPNGFNKAGTNTVNVTAAGSYTVTATGANGCFISDTFSVIDFACPPPMCLPIEIVRIRKGSAR